MVAYQGMIAENTCIHGHNGDLIEAYVARPLGVQSCPSMVVIHHAPGWDEWIKEVTRKFAYHGYAAIAPHLYSRSGPGSPDDVAAAARAAGGVPDAQYIGDATASVDYLRTLPTNNGKVGIMGFCSGGRHAYIAACRVPGIDAAVDCWGGRVVAGPEQLSERSPVAPLDMTPDMQCPIIGIFGNDDKNPSPAEVDRTEEELKKHGKTYEFHRYDGAGHGFFAVDRPGYRSEQATDGWKKVFAFLEKNLDGPAR
ncbi:MAG: carboxymethylenebutenolidase [Chloroflexota bacterium]|nr:carboxymethylenebutenolidase [Chloroflexota bacterium]